MLKITILEKGSQRRLVLEGKLIEPWTTELRRACEKAKAEPDGRELLIDAKSLTAVSHQGEDLLLGLMNDGIKFRCCGVFTKLILKQLRRRKRKNLKEIK